MLWQLSMLWLANSSYQSETKPLAIMIRDGCPRCGSTHTQRNGHIRRGKQSYRCKDCGRQLVSEFEQRRVSDEEKALIERLRRERLSLPGICRVVGVTMRWLMGFAVECYDGAPEDLNVQRPQCPDNVIIRRLEAEADELCSFVGKKSNKHWLWLAMAAHTRQVIAFHGGDRRKRRARKLWKKIR